MGSKVSKGRMAGSDFRMKFRALAALCVMLLCAALQAQPLPTLSCRNPAGTMLWQVTGAELDASGVTVHLFGSIHVGKPDFYPLPEPVESLFRKADHLVFEVDPQAAADPQMAMRMQMQGLLPAGQTLDTVLTPATLTDLRIVMDRLGIPMINVMSMKPWMVTLLLTNIQVNALGYDAENGLEAYFVRQMDPGTDILELESMQSQLDLLDALDPDAFLGYSLREFDANNMLMNNMVRAWQCGDHEELADILGAAETSADFSPAEEAVAERLHQQLFTRRNAAMTEGVEAFIRDGEGSYFVVVGAGHLLGEDSMITLLQQQGYTVTSVGRSP